MLRELLRYLHTNRGKSDLSEYAIGVDALGRRPEFDPKTDATVRVQIARLRQRLKDYYDNEGAQDPIRIVISAGSYRPEFEQIATSRPEAPAPASPARFGYLWTAAVILALICIALAVDDFRLRSRAPTSARPAAHEFWTAFTRGGSVSLVVPVPLFFLWKDRNLVARDFAVNEPAALPRSEYLSGLQKQLGQPEISQLYTVASDTLAAGVIARYLQDRNVAVNLVDTPTVSVEAFGNQNTVLLIGPGTINEAEPLLRTMSFTLPQGAASVVNRKPRPGEPPFWKDVQLAPLRMTGHGIIARLPGRVPGTQIVLLASRYNLSLASILTTRTELDALSAIHKANGAPSFFEIVVQYERNNDRTLRAKPVAIREIAAAQP